MHLYVKTACQRIDGGYINEKVTGSVWEANVPEHDYWGCITSATCAKCKALRDGLQETTSTDPSYPADLLKDNFAVT